MNVTNIVWSVATGALAGGEVAAAFTRAIQDSWIEKLKSHYAAELETLKDACVDGSDQDMLQRVLTRRAAVLL